MDRDPDGDYFRVRKVMEEAVPAALNSRPNKVTKPALVDQAFCLQEHVIDSRASHARTFRYDRVPIVQHDLSSVFEMKSLIWKHQSSIRYAKQLGKERVVPPRAFYDTLESLLKPKINDRGPWKALLDDLKNFTLEHSLMEQSTKKSGENLPSPNVEMSTSSEAFAVAACEGMVTNLTKLIDTDESDEIYSGVWITILSLLSLDQQSADKVSDGRSREASKPSSGSSTGREATSSLLLQVGALMPFFQLDQIDANKGPSNEETFDHGFDWSPELFTYFAKAAAVYVERSEIIEAQKKQQETQGRSCGDTPGPTTSEGLSFKASHCLSNEGTEMDPLGGNEGSHLTERSCRAETETGQNTSWDGQQESGSDHDEDNIEEAAEVNDSPADEADPQSSDGSESSSSEGSSSSSSDEHNADSQPEIPEAAAFVESERDISTDDDDDVILREALGINLARDEAEAEAVRVILADTVAPMEDESLALGSTVETPVSVSEDASTGALNVVTEEESDALDEPTADEGEEGAPLPQLPTPNAPYPWIQPGPTGVQTSDPDALPSGISPPMDPSNLSHFAAVPSSCVLLISLNYAEAVMHRHEAFEHFTESTFDTVAGGMGHELFSMKKDPRQEPVQRSASVHRHFVFQLVVSSLLSIEEKRGDAIEHYNQAVSREKIASRTDGDGPGFTGSTESSASGEEQDDPALTFALNYVEDDVSLSVESLENKGMKRKAAAAAHDAETLRRTLRKRMSAWKSRVGLYSRCMLVSLRCLTDRKSVV